MGKKLILLIMFLAYLTSCQENKNRRIYQGDNNQEIQFHECDSDEINTDGKFAAAEFGKKTFTVPNITEGDVIFKRFVFENKGDGKLAIFAVSTECGCTKVNYPTSYIESGESDYIDVFVDTKGLEGEIERVVIVNSNSIHGNDFLVIKGTVTKKEEK